MISFGFFQRPFRLEEILRTDAVAIAARLTLIEFAATLAELSAIAQADSIGCSSPAIASGMMTAL